MKITQNPSQRKAQKIGCVFSDLDPRSQEPSIAKCNPWAPDLGSWVWEQRSGTCEGGTCNVGWSGDVMQTI